MQEEFIINQSLTEKTLIKANISILLKGRIVIYMAILLVFLIVNKVNSFDNTVYEGSQFYSTIHFAIPFLVIGFILYTSSKVIKKNYKKNQRYYNDVTITLSKENFKTEGKDFQNTNKWENYYKIKETKDWFLIFIDKHQAHVIEKSQIKEFSQEDLKKFFRLLSPKRKVSLK